MLEIGSVVDGKYKILNKIGQGGMSVVYLAMNERANKQWAIKEVRKDGIKDYEVVKQGLIVETDLLKKLNHPNLPSIVDVIDRDGSFLIVMDYIEGKSLLSYLEDYGPQMQDDVIDWAKQMCDVLGYLHSRKPPIVYRDIKPGNIMLRPDGRVMLIDFGTAREFKERNVADTVCLGTVGYAAPEQFGGKGQTDARTDIYGLGATLYHLVTGYSPCDPPFEILPIRQINPALSSGLEKILLKCTEKNPDERYQSCEELRYALDNYNKIDDIYKKKQKRKLGAFISCIAAAVLFLFSGFFAGRSADAKIDSDYENLIEKAEKANEQSDKNNFYTQAVAVKPESGEAYLGLVGVMKEDGVFTLEEEEVLQRIISNNETTLKDNVQEYADVCFEVGKLYWYYYNYGADQDENSSGDNKTVRMKSAIKWFDLTVSNTDSSYTHYAMAAVYKDIGLFYRDIVMNTKEASDSGTYRQLFDNYNKLLEMINQKNEGEIVELELYELIQTSVDQYRDKFKSDGISEEEILKILNAVENNLNDMVTTTSVTEEMKINIISAIAEVRLKVKNTFQK